MTTEWSAFEGGAFGWGLVLVRGDSIIEVRLPEQSAAEEMVARLWPSATKGSTRSTARQIAMELERAFREGTPVQHLPVTFPAGTEFQKRILDACRSIPHGTTVSYSDLAARAGNPPAIRAAASVMARNRLPLVIPCHRVIKADGSIGGFGGSVPMKEHLLLLERRAAQRK